MNGTRQWVGLGVIGVIAIVVGLILGRPPAAGELAISVTWPERISRSVDGKVVVFATDASDPHEPRAGAEVVLTQLRRDESFTAPVARRAHGDKVLELARGVTDSDGLAVLDLPHMGANGQGLREPALGQPVELLVHVSKGWDAGWQLRTFAVTPRVALALSTDRPLYQPGQFIRMRSLGVDPDTGAPVAGTIKWEVRDPKGNLVFSRDRTASASGVSSAELALPSQCTQGQYTVTGSSDGATETLKIDVQPFRLPRYKVQVETTRETLGAGDTLSGSVSAATTYGDPVAAAALELSITTERTGGVASSKSIEGVLDSEGRFSFSWPLAADTNPGSAVVITALVSSDSGRAERGMAKVAVRSAALSVDILPRDGRSFSVSRATEGLVHVTDARGEPVGDADVRLSMPTAREEKVLMLKTDAGGLARFTWANGGHGDEIRALVTRPGGSPQRRTISVRIDASAAFAHNTPVAHIGEVYPFQILRSEAPLKVLAFSRGYTVATASMAHPIDGVSEGTITLGPGARGLTTLVAFTLRGERAASFPVWVTGDDERVNVEAQPSYEPGQLATLGLSFPAGRGAPPSRPPVVFGLVGVDEALYALKERTNQPLEVLLRHDPDTVNAASVALSHLDTHPGAQGLEAAWARAAYLRDLGDTSEVIDSGGRDVTSSFVLEARRPWVDAFLLLVMAMGLLAVFIGARATFRSVTKAAFSWRAFGLLAATALGALVIVSLMTMVSGEYMAGGLSVWGVLVVVWLIVSAVRTRELPTGEWLLSFVLVGLFVGAGAATQSGGPAPTDWVAWLLVAAMIGPAVLLVVEFVLWAFVFKSRGQDRAGHGLASLVGLVLSTFLLTFLITAGDAKMAYDEAAPMVMSKRSTGAGQGVRREMALEETTRAPGAPPPPEKPAAAARVRSWFPETMVWMPEVLSDSAGHAEVAIEIPDSITTWRLNVSASSWDGRLGEAEQAVLVKKDFFAELDLPTHLIVGDRLDVPVTLVNNLAESRVVTVGAETSGGLHVEGLPTSAMTVSAGSRLTFMLEVSATAAGAGALELHASAADGSTGPPEVDAVRRSASISADGRHLVATKSGIIRAGWRAALATPADALTGSTARVDIFPNAVADAMEGLDGMLRRPAGCFEQTASANYPNVMVKRALAATKPERWPGGAEKWAEADETADQVLSLGYQRMLAFQSGGGFGLYPGKPPKVMLTAYGVMQLSDMSGVTEIDRSVIERAGQWLASQQNQGGTWPVYAARISGGTGSAPHGDPAQLRSTSFVTWALLSPALKDRHQWNIDRALTYLAGKYEEASSPDTLALVAIALSRGGRTEAANKVVEKLVSGVSREGARAHWPTRGATWMGGWGSYADVETTALAAYALLDTETHGELLGPVLAWLAERRSAYGGWGSTQATVWALRVFERLREVSAHEDVTLGVSLDGQPLAAPGKGGLGGPVILKPTDLLLRTFERGDLGDTGEALFSVTSSASTAAMVRAQIAYAVPWTSPSAQVPGERLALSLQANPVAARGAEMEIAVTVRNPGDTAYGATIVELPLPPACYVEQERFEAMLKSGTIERFEVLPTHVRLYLRDLPPQSQSVYAYTVRPLLKGTVSLPPARAYVFYAPDPITEVDGGGVTVR